MDMLIADVPLDQLKALPLADGFDYSFHLLFNVSIGQCLVAVFDYPNHVVLADVSTMAKIVQSTIIGWHKLSPPFFGGDFIIARASALNALTG
jgi:hypothetical protein